MRRVVITGQGTINPLGKSVTETSAAFADGRCGIGELDIRDVDRLTVKVGGQVRNFEPDSHFDRQELALYDRFTQFAIIAADEAVDTAGLSRDEFSRSGAGIVLGTAGGGLNTWDDSYRKVYEEKKRRVHPFVVPKLMNNAAASNISMKYDLIGPSFSVSTACSSSNHAIGLAFQMIRTGMTDIMLTGGSESTLCFGGVKAWEGLRVMSNTACRPFCATRNGMVQGEGAAVFVLEEFEYAKRRGADILAEVSGFAMSSDAQDIVNPSKVGAARAISGALRDSGIALDDIGYINAHGTGTTVNDRTECSAIREVFGAAAETLMLSSTKSMHGHLIGGTGAVELLACILALRHGIIAPTINHLQFDPDCDLDVVPNEARQAKIRATMSNAFAFGGMNAVLVLRSI
ncbi:MAG: beta-ketoacyl-[acyl-carrier-protein] synthase family protein [Rhodobacteraceae bacterium]|nr:beta-ketoacyl-[acyl-carrier-protein] synthase family protein [Paracoccaceae bacterium]